MPEARASAPKNLESENFEVRAPARETPPGWLKFALLTAASVVAGGVATAWFYRKTLARLRETGETQENPHFGIPDGRKANDSSDEI
jgi:hypothetical protein